MIKKWILLLTAICLLLAGCGQATPEQEPTFAEPAITEPAVTESTAPEPAPLFADTLQELLPQDVDSTSYTLTLTPEQAAQYKESYFILFQNSGDDRYLPFFYSRNLTLEGNTLRANFNGKIPYVLDNADRCCLTSITEITEQDGLIHYAIDMKLGNYTTGDDGTQEYAAEPYRIHAVCDPVTGQILHTQILPRNQSATDIFQTGPDRLQPEIPAIYAFPLGNYYYPVENSDGTLRPFTQWEPGVYTTGTSWPGKAGLNLAYGRLSEVTSPVATDEIYLVFLVVNQDDSTYGSELIPVPVQEVTLPERPKAPLRQITWDSGNRILLEQIHGTSIYLRKTPHYGDLVYDIQILNESGLPVKLRISDLVYNDRFMNVDIQDVRAESGEWGGSWPFSTPVAAMFEELDKVNRLTFHVKLFDAAGDLLLDEMDFQVDLSGSAAQKAFYHNPGQLDVQLPYREFLAAENQVLLEKDGVRISLLKAGTVKNHTSLTCLYRVENTTDEWRHFVHNGTAVNDIYVSEDGAQLNLPPGAIYYSFVSITDTDIPSDIHQVGSVKLGLGTGTGKAGRGPEESGWYAIKPQNAVTPTILKEGDLLLLEEQGLRLTLTGETKDSDGNPVWEIVVVNTTDENMKLEPMFITAVDAAGNVTENLTSFQTYQVGANQRALISITGLGDQTISLRLRATDFSEKKLLFTTEGYVTLTPSWMSGNEQ